MIEHSLAYLGMHLSKIMNLPKTQVVYSDKELIFSKMSDKSLPLDLPAVAYGNSDITSTHLNTRPFSIVANVNVTQTLATLVEVLPVTMEIQLVILCSHITQHFQYAKNYYWLAKRATFETLYTIENQEIPIETSIHEISPLTVPPDGKEGRDYDRGTYYALEGTFKINSFFIYSKDEKLIRKVDLTWQVGSL